MKKNIVRVLAFVLVLILALGILPLGAIAADVGVIVGNGFFDKAEPAGKNFQGGNIIDYVVGKAPVEIKTSKYDQHDIFDGELYDAQGVIDLSKYQNANKKFDIKSSVSFKKDGSAMVVYTPHQHALSYWYYDSTTHWRECLVCKKFVKQGFWEQFMFQNWHSDGDEDRICDVCGGDIPYHDVTVVDSKGGKITVNLDEAPHRRKITATVEAEEGYKLKKLHFTKVRDDGSKQEITRRKKNGEFWTYMPTYDLEVSAEFVKKK